MLNFLVTAKDLLDDDWVEETRLAVHPGYDGLV